MNTKHTITDTTNYWTEIAKHLLINKKIIDVRYMTKEEANDMRWHKRPLVFVLDDNTLCFLSMDDEGNDGGSLFYQNQDINSGVLPTLGL
jgi:hypothetical protein